MVVTQSFLALYFLLFLSQQIQVAEFMAVLRMRSVDVSAAAARSEAFVRRMWSGTVCDKHHTDTHKLRTLGLITSLGRWLFRALCFSLAPDPPCPPDIPDRLEVNLGMKEHDENMITKGRREFVLLRMVK